MYWKKNFFFTCKTLSIFYRFQSFSMFHSHICQNNMYTIMNQFFGKMVLLKIIAYKPTHELTIQRRHIPTNALLGSPSLLHQRFIWYRFLKASFPGSLWTLKLFVNVPLRLCVLFFFSMKLLKLLKLQIWVSLTCLPFLFGGWWIFWERCLQPWQRAGK